MGDGRSSRGSVVLRFFAVFGALILSGVVTGQAGASPADRSGDPVVIKGSAVPGMNGIAPDQIIGFRWDGEGFVQVPVQVDERKTVSVGTLYPDNPMPAYVISNDLTFDIEVFADAKTRVGPDNDLNLDANDEIAFMGDDTGSKAPAGATAPEGTAFDGKVAEVAVTDPVDGTKAYYYLFKGNGSLDPSADADYVNYDFHLNNIGPGENLKDDYGYSNSNNPEDSEVSTKNYTLHSTDRWSEDKMEINAGDANGTDILDREVAQASLTGCGRSEVTFSGNWTTAQRGGDNDEGTYLSIIDGPVRAIRTYMGANSGPYVEREHIYYENREDNDIYLRVHPMYDLYSWTDYSPAAAGMTYRNFKNPAGVPVDGSPDSLTPATSADFAPGMVAWEQLSGPQGTATTVSSVDTTIDPPKFKSFYLDDSTRTGPNEVQCGGDGKAFANSGFGIGEPDDGTGFHVPNTDPRLGPALGGVNDLTVHRTRYFGSPETNGADAVKLAERVKEPLAATGAAYVPTYVVEEKPGKAKFKLTVPKKTLKVKAGKHARFKFRLKNVGKGESNPVTICADAPGHGIGSCLIIGGPVHGLAAGKAIRRKLSLKIARRFHKGKKLKIRVVAKAKGIKAARGIVRVKVK